MSLVTMAPLLADAERAGCGVGAFSVGSMEMVMGAIRAAEEMNTPIILQIAQVRLGHSPLHLMGPMMLSAAREAKVGRGCSSGSRNYHGSDSSGFGNGFYLGDV